MLKYHWILRTLHWLMAVLILVLIVVGNNMASLPKEALDKYALYPWHKSFGLMVLALAVVRVLVHYHYPRPLFPAGISQLEQKMAKLAQVLMYLLIFMIPLAGYIMSSNYGIAFFGYPLPIIMKIEPNLAYWAWNFHTKAPYALLVIVFLHIAGALKHKFFDKKENDILKLMW